KQCFVYFGEHCIMYGDEEWAYGWEVEYHRDELLIPKVELQSIFDVFCPGVEIRVEIEENTIYVGTKDRLPHVCEPGSAYLYDSNEHWLACDCGEVLSSEKHQYGDWSPLDADTVQRICTVCGYTQKRTPKLSYKVNSDGKTCTITGIGSVRDSHLVIPETIDGYTVTAIKERAFVSYDDFNAVTLPKTLKSVGSMAFYCNRIVDRLDLYIEDLAAWCQIEFADSASNPMVYAKNVYVEGRLTDTLVIPESVTAIGSYTFTSANFEHIVFHDGIRRIGDGAFGNNPDLKEIRLPAGVSVGEYAFWKSYAVEELVFPGGVTLGEHSFAQLDALKRVEFLDGDTVLESSVFANCEALETVILPKGLKELKSSTFWYCTSLKSLNVPEGVESINLYALHHCDQLRELYLPSTLVSFSGELQYCLSLSHVYYNGDFDMWCQITPREKKGTDTQRIIWLHLNNSEEPSDNVSFG
ncbi:MAG: leucine-rich repeat protein, partial [Clostridia bacterium]|nr:leucine-rich repeat protein [Clostridia bacterium]MBR6553802.1 leucine-rich repeat protein [Clostridia bacterium]